MTLLESWKAYAEKERSQEEYNEFWKYYFEKERNNYQRILQNKETVEGKMKEVSESFNMTPEEFLGFVDGANTSIKEPIELETLTEDTQIKLEFDFEKLFFNMLDAKADWLYNLTEWDDVLSVERRNEIAKEFKTSKIAVSSKVGRNETCPCGSGKKYKKCCGK